MRLPGRCAGCGERVELATDRVKAFTPHGNSADRTERVLHLPMAWCALGTDNPHNCSDRI